MLNNATLNWISQNGFDANDVNLPGRYEDTPLILACRRGEASVADELIKAGANIHHRNMDGTTALWACVVSDSFDLADQLLHGGIELNHVNGNGATTLMYACSAGKPDWVKYFLGKGADITIESFDGFNALDLASNIECLRLMKAAKAKHSNNT